MNSGIRPDVHERVLYLAARAERKHQEHLARLRGRSPAAETPKDAAPDEPLCVNLYALTGRKRFPQALGATNPERFPVARLCEAFGDPWVHPGSGGLIGADAIVSGQPLSRSRLEHTLFCESWVPNVGGLIAMNTASRDNWVREHEAAATAAHLKNLGIVTDVRPGTNATDVSAETHVR